MDEMVNKLASGVYIFVSTGDEVVKGKFDIQWVVTQSITQSSSFLKKTLSKDINLTDWERNLRHSGQMVL